MTKNEMIECINERVMNLVNNNMLEEYVNYCESNQWDYFNVKDGEVVYCGHDIYDVIRQAKLTSKTKVLLQTVLEAIDRVLSRISEKTEPQTTKTEKKTKHEIMKNNGFNEEVYKNILKGIIKMYCGEYKYADALEIKCLAEELYSTLCHPVIRFYADDEEGYRYGTPAHHEQDMWNKWADEQFDKFCEEFFIESDYEDENNPRTRRLLFNHSTPDPTYDKLLEGFEDVIYRDENGSFGEFYESDIQREEEVCEEAQRKTNEMLAKKDNNPSVTNFNIDENQLITASITAINFYRVRKKDKVSMRDYIDLVYTIYFTACGREGIDDNEFWSKFTSKAQSINENMFEDEDIYIEDCEDDSFLIFNYEE